MKSAFKNLYTSIEGIAENSLLELRAMQDLGFQVFFDFLTQITPLTEGKKVSRKEIFHRISPVYEFLIMTTILTNPESYTTQTFHKELTQSKRSSHNGKYGSTK